MSTEMTTREGENVSERATARPAVDIYENTDEYLVIADLPAVSKDSLSIHLEDSQLTIEGKIGDEPGDNALERELRLFSYRRTFELPRFVDRDKVTAEFSNGVLSLHLPKADAVRPRRIAVRAG